MKALDIGAVTLLQKILQRYKAPSWDARKIIEEWRSLLIFDLPDVTDVCDFWLHVASLKTPNGTQRFPNMVEVVQYRFRTQLSSSSFLR